MNNGTWAGMIAMGMRYFIYCEPCGRDVELDMTKLPPEKNAIGRQFRCAQCGRKGHSIVSPKSALHCVPVNRALSRDGGALGSSHDNQGTTSSPRP